MKKYLIILSVLAFCLSGANADAYTISQIGTSGGTPGGMPVFQVSGRMASDAFNASWAYSNGGYTVRASGSISVASLSSNMMTLNISIDNTTSVGGGLTEARISSFGFGAADAEGMSSSGGAYLTNTAYNPRPNLPGYDVDVCAFGGRNCAGGGNKGIALGFADSLTMNIYGDFDPDAGVTLDQFAVKFQTNVGSFELAGNPSPVPVPAAAFLLGAGLLGLVGVRRKLQK